MNFVNRTFDVSIFELQQLQLFGHLVLSFKDAGSVLWPLKHCKELKGVKAVILTRKPVIKTLYKGAVRNVAFTIAVFVTLFCNRLIGMAPFLGLRNLSLSAILGLTQARWVRYLLRKWLSEHLNFCKLRC